jgi:hypothetical protein
MPKLYYAITNHGFGHATRSAAIAATIRQQCPEVDLVMVTTAPDWLLQSYLPEPFTQRSVALDVGVLQADSLTMDKPGTLAQLQQIQAQQQALVAQEAGFIRDQGIALVLADIPPLASAIAAAAGVPCWMISNFGWDFIYRPWADELPGFGAIADWIAELFGKCDRLFRLPFHEPMSAFPQVEDVGLTGGNPRYDLSLLRQTFAIDTPPERTVLLTFGGLGLAQIPYDTLKHFPDWCFLTFDRQAPDLPNLRRITDRRYRPVDVMPLCSRILSKPGYSTFAEACRLGIPLVTLPRQDFAEALYLLAELQAHFPHQILDPAQFFSGTWDFLHTAPTPPQQPHPPATNGNHTIATAVANFLS